MAIWRSLSPAQQAQANTEALKVAANPPLTGTPAWLGGPAAPTAPTGFFATLLGGISAASQAAAAVAQAAAAQQTSFLLQQAQAAQQARAQGTSIAAQQSATAVKNVGLLAKLTSGSPSRSTTLPLQTITPGKPVSTGLIVGGVLAAAAIGGILYWQMSKKKAA
jgi:cobalamin biosynthesis Mg chelatase CobN